MKYFLYSFSFIALCFIWNCSAPQVIVDYDRNANFETFKTFQFENEPLGINALDSTRIYNEIQEELSIKGIQPKSQSDLVIRIVPSEYITENSGQNVGVGLGTGGRGIGVGLGVGIPIGRSKKLNQDFRVSFLDRKNNHLIWEGLLNLKMGLNLSPEQKETTYKNGVRKLFANYPPKQDK